MLTFRPIATFLSILTSIFLQPLTTLTFVPSSCSSRTLSNSKPARQHPVHDSAYRSGCFGPRHPKSLHQESTQRKARVLRSYSRINCKHSTVSFQCNSKSSYFSLPYFLNLHVGFPFSTSEHVPNSHSVSPSWLCKTLYRSTSRIQRAAMCSHSAR